MKTLPLILLLASLSTFSQAQEFYAGANISSLFTELTYSDGESPESQPIAVNLFVGGKFNSYIGVEAFVGTGLFDDDVEDYRYRYNSRYNRDFGYDFELDSVAGAAVLGYIPLPGITDLYAKLGYANVRYDDSDSDKSEADGALFGFGANVNFRDDIALKIELIRYPDGEYEEFDIDVETLAFNIGVAYTF